MTADTPLLLLVEDNPDLGQLLQETLEEWEHHVVLAQTGAEALEALSHEHVSLLLLDHHLPDMSGLDVLDAIRSEQRAIPPAVLMTAEQHATLDPRWPELVEVLHKPFDLSELSAVLGRRLPLR